MVKYIVLVIKVILYITIIILEKVQQNKTKVIDNFHFIIKRQETGLTKSIFSTGTSRLSLAGS